MIDILLLLGFVVGEYYWMEFARQCLKDRTFGSECLIIMGVANAFAVIGAQYRMII